jgi:DNA modification methylase
MGGRGRHNGGTVETLRLEWRSPSELAENPRNWRTHPESQVRAITAALSEVGWAGACLYNEQTGRLIDGHARRKVALAQGSERIPVLVGSWDEAAEAKILATLDPLAAMAEADGAQLDALLREVQTGDADLASMLAKLAGDAGLEYGKPEAGDGGDEFDPTPENTGPTRTKPGDLWVIGGKHRLLVGDCTDAGNVERLMGGQRAALCFTSPPYGAGNTAKLRDHYEPGAAERKSFYVGHSDRPEEWAGLMIAWYAAVRPVVDAVVCNVQMLADNKRALWEWVAAHLDEFSDVVVWDKNGGAPQMQRTVLFVFGGNGSRAIPFADFHGTLANVIRIDPRGQNEFSDVHRAVFPVELPTWVLGSLCSTAPTVLDPFLGSGTTLIAAHRLGRTCYGMEIEPRYADVILKRAEAEGLTCYHE